MEENKATAKRIHRAEYAQHRTPDPTVGDLRDFLKACDEQGIPDGALLQRHALVFGEGNPFRGLYAERVVDLPRPVTPLPPSVGQTFTFGGILGGGGGAGGSGSSSYGGGGGGQ
jgi:hypothetical protein